MDTCLYGHMYVWTYARMDICMYGHMYVWTHVCMDICTYGHMYVWTYARMDISHVKEGVIPTEIACKPCHGVSKGITNCCTGVRQPKVHMLKYKKV